MQEEYEDKGVVLLALSKEPVETVRKFLRDYTAKARKSSEGKKGSSFEFNYVIGVNAGATLNAFNIRSYPTILVIDTKGKIVYHGHRPSEAEKEIQRLLKESPPRETLSLVETAAKRLYKKATSYAKKKKYAKALDTFEECAEQFKDTEYGKKAAAGAKKIRGSKKMMSRIKRREAEKECENWLELARNCAKAGQLDTAAEYYDKIIKKYPGTKHAKIAKEEKAKL